MNACALCGNPTEGEATVVDDGGGAFVSLCGRCFHGLTVDKCDMCERPEPEWGDGRPGRVTAENGDGLLCPECRRDLLYNADRLEGGVPA